ncbi:hypothetical protein M427DRAFT_44005 [Gonapodya prolifera JEL478]|uniref:Uncharacterized protein n=1 Tax=Gonapodya prolifera (strain JEL478) TaxID=1344416 RepID=A0A139AHD0_GONPJ|nr:hypothetical protein M427DRAFT_44005 [Gonapodya prolifera JEL478]|eukprot:KXS16216.1 hypothetical protein M427DRAFT_44005 [Gonapodya prolifera JEL478]
MLHAPRREHTEARDRGRSDQCETEDVPAPGATRGVGDDQPTGIHPCGTAWCGRDVDGAVYEHDREGTPGDAELLCRGGDDKPLGGVVTVVVDIVCCGPVRIAASAGVYAGSGDEENEECADKASQRQWWQMKPATRNAVVRQNAMEAHLVEGVGRPVWVLKDGIARRWTCGRLSTTSRLVIFDVEPSGKLDTAPRTRSGNQYLPESSSQKLTWYKPEVEETGKVMRQAK